MPDFFDDASQTPPPGFEEAGTQLTSPEQAYTACRAIARSIIDFPQLQKLLDDISKALEKVSPHDDPFSCIMGAVAKYQADTPLDKFLCFEVDTDLVIQQLYLLTLIFIDFPETQDHQVYMTYVELSRRPAELIPNQKFTVLPIARKYEQNLFRWSKAALAFDFMWLFTFIFLLIAMFYDHKVALPSLLITISAILTQNMYIDNGKVTLMQNALKQLTNANRATIENSSNKNKPEVPKRLIEGSVPDPDRELDDETRRYSGDSHLES